MGTFIIEFDSRKIEELEGDSDILLSNCSPLGKKNIDTRIITKKIAINLRSIESFKQRLEKRSNVEKINKMIEELEEVSNKP